MRPLLLIAALVASGTGCSRATTAPTNAKGNYQDLLALFGEWRAFQRPHVVDGEPIYTSSAMAEQYRALAGWQDRLAAIDSSSWTVPQQVDYQIVRAEMNGLDFDHRVLRPWRRNPGFYVTVFDEQSDQPAREGHQAYGAVELWKLQFPLAPAQAKELAAALRPIPALLRQARLNLLGKAHDLWIHGTRAVKQQSSILKNLLPKAGQDAELISAIKAAQAATDSFIGWLEQQASDKSAQSGIGIANYNWYLNNVQMVPYSWADEVGLMERELARALASLAVEEEKNRALPPLLPVASAEEHARRFNAGIDEYVAFLKQHQILTVRDWMEPALRARIGQFTPGDKREFFTEVDYRDPVMLRTHGYHWIDLGWAQHEPHQSPIRRGPLLYNIFDTRTEGFATAMEELMMHAGLFESRPRSRELIYILIAQRAARALGDLRMHANQSTLEEAARFASENTPRGWLRLDGATVWFEQYLYLTQPGYGTSYLIGKLEVDKLLAARAKEQGDKFRLKQFIDELNTVGLIPMWLVRGEMTVH